MSFTNAQLAQQIANLISYWSSFNEEYANWLGGIVGGGPGLDGKYPLTDYTGSTALVSSPAQLEADVTGLVDSASSYSSAAAASAAAALASENTATTQAGLADAARILAESARTAAQLAETGALDAQVTSVAQANLSGDRAGYSQEWASAAFEVPVSVAAGGDGATTYSALHWATVAQGFAGSIDSNLYAQLAQNETVTGNWGFKMDTIGDFMFWRNGTTGASGMGFRNDDGVKGYIAFDDNGTFGIYDAATSNKLFVDASGNLEADGSLSTGPLDTRVQVGKSTNGWQTNIGTTQHTDAAALSYRSYFGNDVYWDDVADNWVANRTTLGRKHLIDMGYQINAMRFRFYDGVVTAPWADSAWTDMLKLTPAKATFSGGIDVNAAILPVTTATLGLGSAANRWDSGYATTWNAYDGTNTVYMNYTGVFSDRPASYLRNTGAAGAWYIDAESGTVIRDYNGGTPVNIMQILSSGITAYLGINPDVDNSRNLGTAALRWGTVYASTFYVPNGNLPFTLDSNLLTIKPNASAGGWARGMTVVRQSDAARVAGAGFLGSAEAVTGYYIGFGTNWWSTDNAFTLTAAGDITSKGVLTLDRQISTTSYVSLKNQGVQFGYMGASASSIGFWDSVGAWKLSLNVSSGDLTVYGAAVPLNNLTQNLGAPAQRWAAMYGNSLDLTGPLVVGGTASFLGEGITDFGSTLVNLQKEVGFFSAGFQAIGYPAGANYWSGVEFKHNIGTDYRTQIATGTTDGAFAVRYNINGVWGNWHNVWQSGLNNLPRANNSFTLGSDAFRFSGVYATAFYEAGTALASKYAALSHQHSGADITSGTVAYARLEGIYSGAYYSGVPYVGNDGVMEVGRYIDFHEADADASDYSVRLASNGNVLNVYGGPVQTLGGDTWTTSSWSRNLRLSGGTPAMHFEGTTHWGIGNSGGQLYFWTATGTDAAASLSYRAYCDPTGNWTFPTGYVDAVTLKQNGTAVSTLFAAASHTHSYLPLSGGTLTGALVTAAAGIELGHATDTSLTRLAAGQLGVEGKAALQHDGAYTSGKVTFSTSAPSGGSDGDIWFVYT